MMDKISNLLLPIAEKLSKNKYLSAIRDGFVSIMPLVLTASLFKYEILYLIFDYPHKHYTFKYFEV